MARKTSRKPQRKSSKKPVKRRSAYLIYFTVGGEMKVKRLGPAGASHEQAEAAVVKWGAEAKRRKWKIADIVMSTSVTNARKQFIKSVIPAESRSGRSGRRKTSRRGRTRSVVRNRRRTSRSPRRRR